MNILSSIPSFYETASFVTGTVASLSTLVPTQISAVAEQALAEISNELPTTEQLAVYGAITGLVVGGAAVILGIEAVYNRCFPKPPRDTQREELEIRGASFVMVLKMAADQGQDPQLILDKTIKNLIKTGVSPEHIIVMFSKFDVLGDIPEKIRAAQAAIQADRREHQEQLRESIKAALTNGIPPDEIIARFAQFGAFSDLAAEVSHIQEAIAQESARSELHERCMGWTATIN